jgi:tetraacyldisaccharide 4'-kinase
VKPQGVPEALGTFLAPLGHLYAFAGRVRRGAYRRGLGRVRRLETPVVSIGALRAGGSMKTPVVAALARELERRAIRAGIVGHGYRGTFSEAALLVSNGRGEISSNAAIAGDEALELARELKTTPVAVGKTRLDAGKLLIEHCGARVVLLDGAFQHVSLARDLDIVCVAEDDFRERVLPAGLLRESVRTLAVADVILAERRGFGAALGALRSRRAPSDFFEMERSDFRFQRWRPPGSDAGTSETVAVPGRIVALCALARPEQFVHDLEGQGSVVAVLRTFRDHHPFSNQELSEAAGAARGARCDAVVTTAKDAVRISAWPYDVPLVVFAARVSIERLDALVGRIVSLVEAHDSGRTGGAGARP